MLLGGLVCAAGMIFLVNFILTGPKLGIHYDFLLNYRTPAVSREILIIDTDDYIEGRDIFSILMTLTEMQASDLILTGRVSPSSSPIFLSDTEIRRRFIDEYTLLGSNIRNLFEGIRMGFVSPVQAPVFVEQVVELAERGRDRLITTLIDRDEDLLRAIAVFGNFLHVDTRPQLDSDGVLRRVKPVDLESNTEHPVYQSLKNRYDVSQIESSNRGLILWLRSYSPDENISESELPEDNSSVITKDLDIPLDLNGNIIAAGISGFRQIDISVFREYEEAGKMMLSLLDEANDLRVFSQTAPDRIPLFLGVHAQFLLDELFNTPDIENRYAWITGRVDYFYSLEEFFNSPVQAQLIGMYEEQIADLDSSYNEQLDFLITRKNDLIRIFSLLNENYAHLSSLHLKLKDELSMSLCIMGPWPDAQYSAVLANVLITGDHINPVDKTPALLWSFLAVLIVLLIIFLLRPFIMLPLGFVLSLIPAAVFAYLFVYHYYWIDPLIVLSSSFMGTIVIFLIKSMYLNYRSRSFRMAYRTAVSKDILRSLIKSGRPRLSETSVYFAAVIAIRDIYLLAREDKEKPQDTGKLRKTFFTMAKKSIFSAGAVIAGFENDTILACFGSSLDKSYHPVTKACNLVKELMKKEKITWCFGIDAGECCFSWSAETGFAVSGRPAVRARILVSKAAGLKKRALVTNSVLEKIHKDSEKLGSFFNESGSYHSFPK